MQNFNTITTRLGDFCDQVNQEIINPANKISVRKVIDAINNDPVASACVSLKSARAMQLMNTQYINKDNKDIEKFIRKNFDNMMDDLPTLTGQMSSATVIGHSCAEIIYKPQARHVMLAGFHVLNPERITYRATQGRLTQVRYNDGGKDKYVPINKVIHVTNGIPTAFGAAQVYGISEGHRAYSLIRLKQLILSNMAITSRRFATGFIFGKTNSTEDTVAIDPKTGKPKLDANGKPVRVSTAYNMFQNLGNLQNFSYMVVDKNEELGTLNVNGGEQFWNLALNIVDQQILRCFQIPDTAFAAPTNPFGNGLVSTNQLSLLDSSVMGFVVRLKERLLEKVVRTLIYQNFGKHHGLGDWEVYNEVNEQRDQALVGQILQAVSMGAISNQDYDALNILREKLTLPKIDVTTVAQQKELEAKIQSMQQNVAQSELQQGQEEVQGAQEAYG